MGIPTDRPTIKGVFEPDEVSVTPLVVTLAEVILNPPILSPLLKDCEREEEADEADELDVVDDPLEGSAFPLTSTDPNRI